MGREPHPGAFSIEEAQERFAELFDRAAAGEEVIIARDGGVFKLVPLEPIAPISKQKRVPGLWKGKIDLGPEFFEDLPEEELRLWEGGDEKF